MLMASSLVVLRTSVLIMFLLILVTGLYVRHVTRLATSAAAQSAATAAAQAAIAAGWDCEGQVPSEAQAAAAAATLAQTQHLAVQPKAVALYTDACNLIAAVTAAPLNTRVAALQASAVACRSAGKSATLNIPRSC